MVIIVLLSTATTTRRPTLSTNVKTPAPAPDFELTHRVLPCRLPQQPDAVAAPDAHPTNRPRRIRSPTNPADRAWGIRPAANATNRAGRIRPAANATNRARGISTANSTHRAGGIRSYSTYHDAHSSQKMVRKGCYSAASACTNCSTTSARSGRAPPVRRRRPRWPCGDRRPTDSPTTRAMLPNCWRVCSPRSPGRRS